MRAVAPLLLALVAGSASAGSVPYSDSYTANESLLPGYYACRADGTGEFNWTFDLFPDGSYTVRGVAKSGGRYALDPSGDVIFSGGFWDDPDIHATSTRRKTDGTPTLHIATAIDAQTWFLDICPLVDP